MSVLSFLIRAILSNAIRQNTYPCFTVRELINHHVNGVSLIMLLICISFTISIHLDHLSSTFV